MNVRANHHTGLFGTLLAMMLFLCSLSIQAENGQQTAQLCAGCHGSDGVGLGQDYPNLAGQKKAYLIKQLNAFKSGQRIDPTMNAMAKSLSDEQIQSVAGYFSGLASVAEVMSPPNDGSTSGADHLSSASFSETVFATLKESGQVMTLPDGIRWDAKKVILYNALSSDGRLLLVTSPNNNKLFVFETSDQSIKAIVDMQKAPKGVKISPNDEFAYVVSEGANLINVVDLSSFTVIKTIVAKTTPHNVRFNSQGDVAYVTLQGGEGIGVIDTSTHSITKIIEVPGITGPHNLDLSMDESKLYVRDFVNSFAILEIASGEVKAVHKVGNGHGGIDVSPSGEWVATGAIGDTFITVMNTNSGELTNITVPKGPHGVRFSADNRWLYVVSSIANQISVIDVGTLTLSESMAAPKFPFWLAVKGNP